MWLFLGPMSDDRISATVSKAGGFTQRRQGAKGIFTLGGFASWRAIFWLNA
jgi:hypothetical protein